MVTSLHGFRLKPPPDYPVVFPEASSKLSSQKYLYRPHLCLLGAESKLTGMTSFEVLYDPMSNLH